MRDHGGYPERAQPEDDLAERERPIRIRRLDQEVLRIAAEPEAAQLVVREAVELFERDLAAWQELEVDTLALERRAELSHAALHRIGRRRVVLSDVRGRCDGRDPVGHSCARGHTSYRRKSAPAHRAARAPGKRSPSSETRRRRWPAPSRSGSAHEPVAPEDPDRCKAGAPRSAIRRGNRGQATDERWASQEANPSPRRRALPDSVHGRVVRKLSLKSS